MEPHHETGFPTTLCRWVGEIVQSSPEAGRLTLLELIVGALLASGGHVTQAILVLTPRLGWQAYHWMLEHGRFRLLGLISALCRIVRQEIEVRRCFVVIDDTLAPRCSAQAPGVAVRFDHAAKTNRPAFLLCQCFVTLSAVVPCRDRPRSVPLVTGLCRSSGNAGKIAMAKGLLRAVGALVPAARRLVHARLATALRLGHQVIGQAIPPCSRCRHRASPEGAAVRGSMARALMPTRLQHCPPRSTPSPAMVAGRPGCAMPCAARASSRASSSGGASCRRAPARRACCCPPIPRCPPPSRPIPRGGASSPCSAILRWLMAWGPCGNAGALLCCAGSTSFRSPAPCWSC